MHLAELSKPDVLKSMMPGLGREWTEILASIGHVYYRAASYATEWESVAARWAVDDHTLLQPAEPCWLIPLVYVGNMLKQTVAKKELELCGGLPGPVCAKGGEILWHMVDARPVRVRDRAVANARVVATRRLGVTSGTGDATGALLASGAKESNRPPRMSRRSRRAPQAMAYQSTFGQTTSARRCLGT
jgi:hypothetical protein